MNFKVKCIKNGGVGNKEHFTVGKVYSVTSNGLEINTPEYTYRLWMKSCGENDFDKLKEWFSENTWVGDFEFELVDENADTAFTKSDLKNGDIVVINNEAYITCLGTGTFIGRGGFMLMKYYNEDLTEGGDDHQWDIVKVYRPIEAWHCQFKESCYSGGELVFDRNPIRELTIEEVEKKFGIKVKV